MKLPTTGIKPLDEYCAGVKSGEIDVCKWVRLAVDRHYRDLEKSKDKDYPYYFEPKAAEHYVHFFRDHLKHYEGAVAGEPIIFEPWQWFSFGSIFGWLKKKRFKGIPIRRFRSADIYVPKKNGKSIISGGTALYMMDYDEWPGAQCYILAKNQSHAKDLGYRAAVNMVEKSPELSAKYKVKEGAAFMGIYYAENNNAFYKPLTSKPESEDGRNVHFCGPDETKDWRERAIYNVMKNGTVNAPNSLIMSTTTAGTHQDSLGYERQKYLEKVLEGTVDDDTTFGVIYTVDEEDKLDENGDPKMDWWMNPDLWRKANPNYGVSVYDDAITSLAKNAKESPGERNAFQTKHLNVWHSAMEDYIESSKWARCMVRKISPMMNKIKEGMKPYAGRTAFGGLDMGSVSDFASLATCLKPEEDKGVWNIIPFFWIPELTVPNRKNAQILYPWIEEGYIYTTPGETTHQDFIEEAILTIASMLSFSELAYDRYRLDMIVQHLMDEGVEMVPFGQGYVSMSPAVDNLERMVLEQDLNHGGNPVMSWMLSNVVIRKDPAGNRKFEKDKSQDKIDGVVAMAMALSRGTISEGGDEGSVYDERGMVVI